MKKILKETIRMLWNFSAALMVICLTHDLLALLLNKTYWFNWN